MDRIKEVAPIWKKEIWADGASEWVGNEVERKADLDGTRTSADERG
jgi:molybdopterin synthase catalytic subunit